MIALVILRAVFSKEVSGRQLHLAILGLFIKTINHLFQHGDKHLKIIIAFLLSLFYCSCVYANPNAQLIGTWRVTQWIAGEPVTQLSKQQVNALIGKHLVITSKTISINALMLPTDDESCAIADDSTWISIQPSDYFSDNYSVNITKADIQAPFWSLDSDCIQAFTTTDPDQILFVFGSDFFKAMRAHE